MSSSSSSSRTGEEGHGPVYSKCSSRSNSCGGGGVADSSCGERHPLTTSSIVGAGTEIDNSSVHKVDPSNEEEGDSCTDYSSASSDFSRSSSIQVATVPDTVSNDDELHTLLLPSESQQQQSHHTKTASMISGSSISMVNLRERSSSSDVEMQSLSSTNGLNAPGTGSPAHNNNSVGTSTTTSLLHHTGSSPSLAALPGTVPSPVVGQQHGRLRRAKNGASVPFGNATSQKQLAPNASTPANRPVSSNTVSCFGRALRSVVERLQSLRIRDVPLLSGVDRVCFSHSSCAESVLLCGLKPPRYLWYMVSGSMCDVWQIAILFGLHQFIADGSICWCLGFVFSIPLRHVSHRYLVFGDFVGGYWKSLARMYAGYSIIIILSTAFNFFMKRAFDMELLAVSILTLLWTGVANYFILRYFWSFGCGVGGSKSNAGGSSVTGTRPVGNGTI